ncbi:MAG TPA: FecR domain-containing protein [Burkholderiales bacterium]|nr:FecR domain-containing protein [Burkholderiales bacterium]
MKTLALGCAGTLLLLAAQLATAATPNAMVEAVQMPAWVERGALTIPLAPGMELRNQDRLHTGANSKLLLKMGEGSLVRLGGNATLVLEQMAEGKDRVFDAAMKVLRGAFRFTTGVLQAHRRRNISITIDTVTAGIRGTDVWGKAAADKDIVCLIEGSIEVRRGQAQPFQMDQAMSFYVAPKGAPALPVATVAPKQLRVWSAETQIAPGAGAAWRGGKWKVIAASADTRAEALKLNDALRAAGYAAEIRQLMRANKRVYEVRLTQLPSKVDAEALAASIRGRMGVTEPRVSM